MFNSKQKLMISFYRCNRHLMGQIIINNQQVIFHFYNNQLSNKACFHKWTSKQIILNYQIIKLIPNLTMYFPNQFLKILHFSKTSKQGSLHLMALLLIHRTCLEWMELQWIFSHSKTLPTHCRLDSHRPSNHKVQITAYSLKWQWITMCLTNLHLN